ncbi:E3 ubiquitin-protein ligase rnf168-like [Mytilus californianus]|uniref:E3 ubiquitin-protein ligase rnf168-like n=1 Tax=Mytilus californianus TaxID=6549 RepID=UPI00224758E5|nr:E3 ubiquitin-protein ligase rnf168-like [Mytilus californianus]XP_052106416.1 E3 ubiquitin-protein ligase rnf168-like [Mytilus californianus]
MDVDKITIEDCMCSICMCIFVEPVTMPCTHTLCMPCFKQNVEATSLTCPLCRKRISTWARKAAREKCLVNKALWAKIQSMFPDRVERRLEGEDQEDDMSIDVFHPIINLARPGEIRQEYEEQLKRLEKERELERQREQEASEALIRKLEEEQKVKSVHQQLIEERDLELAKELEHVVTEAGTDSPFNLLLKESKNRLTRSRGSSAASSKQSPLTIESFMQKMRDAEKMKEADRSAARNTDSPYPYTCYTPSDKGNLSRPSTVTISSRSSMRSSTSCTSYNTDPDVEWELVTHNENLIGQTDQLENKDRMNNISTTAVRSESSQSLDSINQELNHFKPIKSCPVTPPKRSASGKIVETQVIRTTPRNLSMVDSFSPTTSKTMSDIDAGSPVMKRRLSELEEERMSQVEQNSKATETALCNTEVKKNDISKYFNKKSKSPSPSENIPNFVKNVENNGIILKKVVIPLEPIFDSIDDIRDFDDVMAPLMEINNIQKRPSIKDKPLKVRQRNNSKQENMNNNSVLSPQRSITDWLSNTNCALKSSLNSNNNCGQDMEVDSKEGILNLDIAGHGKNNKLKLKKYPKRKHAAYHISDYVYPQLSPKKRKICIELSSDEESNNGESEDESIDSVPSSLSSMRSTRSLRSESGRRHLKSKRQRESTKLRENGMKKLKSVGHSRHLEKQEHKTMHSFLQPKVKNVRIKTSTHSAQTVCDSVFSDSNVKSVKLTQEEADRQLALQLEKMFRYEEKNKLTAIRIKGSDNEYNFRRKSKHLSEELL